MGSVLALIPARSGSKGIPGKNLRTLGGKTLVQLAVECANRSEVVDAVYLTTDSEPLLEAFRALSVTHEAAVDGILRRPPELASDTAAMVDVVKHALQEVPGPSDQIVVLLQPTQPFRKPEHIQQAITLLRESGADSVVSVVPLPLTHSLDCQLMVSIIGTLVPVDPDRTDLMDLPTRRQDATQTYIRDGTCYAFARKTVETWGSIYGRVSIPLIIDPADSCELDTEADWAAVEQRWKARHGG